VLSPLESLMGRRGTTNRGFDSLFALLRAYSLSASASADTVFILSFSLIMLNTDLHNPNIAENKKMTMEGFVRNNRGIDNGMDVDRGILEDMYKKIKKASQVFMSHLLLSRSSPWCVRVFLGKLSVCVTQ